MNRCLSFGTLNGNGASASISQHDTVRTYDIHRKALEDIIIGIATKKPERGGALGMDIKTGQITRFYLDDQGTRTSVDYSPDADKITEIINQWEQEGIAFCGMIHSHPGQFCEPSEGDFLYARRILTAMPQTLKGEFLMPILTINPRQSTARIQAFTVYLDKNKTRLVKSKLTVDGRPLPASIPINAEVEDDASATVSQTNLGAASTDETIFMRNATLLPLDELSRRTVAVVGCGGSRSFCESLARSGIGRMILIDGDTVSSTNVATQGTYLNEVGQYKTEVIADALRRINPHIQVIEYRHYLDDNVTDEMLAEAIGQDVLSNTPENVLLCGCTDNFPAQDRTVKLALKWGVPYLAGQNYAEGLAGEIVFSYPGLTPACPRCMLASRYNAYEKQSEQLVPVTSEGAPIYVTDLLNGIKAHIAMMLLTYGTGCRIGEELELVKDRNLVLFSNSPLSEERLGLRAFSRVFSALEEEERRALLMGGIVWLKQKPDRPENGFPHCPYCGGTGDLRIIRGLNADTRKPFSLSRLISAVMPIAGTADGVNAVNIDPSAKGGD